MGMIVCKPCLEAKIQEWKAPFDETVGDLQRVPEYNENVQHYNVYQIEEIASKLQPGEMIEIMCTICKKTHVGKDDNGIIKVKYIGGAWQDW